MIHLPLLCEFRMIFLTMMLCLTSQSRIYLTVQIVGAYSDLESSSLMSNYLVDYLTILLKTATAIDKIQEWLDEKVDLILVIGTSGVVYPAAGYAWEVKMKGGKVAVFNIEKDSDGVHALHDWMFEGS